MKHTQTSLFRLLSGGVVLAAAIAAFTPFPGASGQDAHKSSESTGKADRVRDTPITVETSFGTVALHESINSEKHFYVAPRIRFLLLDPDKKVIARPTRDGEYWSVPVQMSMEMVHPAARAELVTLLRKDGREVRITDIRNLQVDGIRVGVAAQEDREMYGVQDFVLTNPQPEAEKLAVNLSVTATKARQFAEAVNEGKVNFTVTYSYNQISVDSRVEMLRASTLLDNQQVRELVARGAEIWSADQMGEAVLNIKREIESKVIGGIGKIEPESLPLEFLIGLFRVEKTWEMTEKQLEELDRRLLKQFDLKVDPKDFQPFRFQKKVIETLGKETGMAKKRAAYFDLYRRDASSMKGSAGLKIGPFGASAEYSREFEQRMNQGNMTDDEFREHIKTFHGVEYTTQMVLERGIKLYDVQKVRAMGELGVISVTLKPTLGTGLRNFTVTPTRVGAVYMDRRFSAVEERLAQLNARLLKQERQLMSLHDYLKELNKGVIGPLVKKNKNIEYTADSDGFVVLYTGSNSPPEYELIVNGYTLARSTAGYTSGMAPVRKGDKWIVKTTINDPNPPDAAGVHNLAGVYPFWVPLQAPVPPR